jgi:hypothetical protein
VGVRLGAGGIADVTVLASPFFLRILVTILPLPIFILSNLILPAILGLSLIIFIFDSSLAGTIYGSQINPFPLLLNCGLAPLLDGVASGVPVGVGVLVADGVVVWVAVGVDVAAGVAVGSGVGVLLVVGAGVLVCVGVAV